MAKEGYKVRLFYRKPRSSGNFSIETSFDQMMAHFPKYGPFQLEKFVSSYPSNGIFQRLLASWEAFKNRTAINHITGDVHFLALATPKSRTILTIHDCVFAKHPSPIARFFLMLFWLKWPVGRSKIITTVSEATKKDVIRYTNCSPEKIKVIPTIINNLYGPSPKSFNQDRPVILHIGIAFNKNLERHIQAIAGIKCHFHIIGKITKEHRTLLQKLNIDYHSEYNISNEAMLAAYQNADLLLFASTLEGFGMPIIEAQAVGRPVVTSNISSMPEVAGNGACLIDPFDVECIRAGVIRIIEDEQYRTYLVQKGFENVKRFRADSVARQYEAVYQQVIDEL